jgi:hypothetical protein
LSNRHCLVWFTRPHLTRFEFLRPPFACDDFSEFKDRKAPETGGGVTT